MQNGKIKLKDLHKREALFALFLFALPFLPLLHLNIPKTYLPIFKFFGLTFDGTYITQQMLVWEFLRRLVFATYCLVFYYTSNSKVKPLLITLFFLNIFEQLHYWLDPIKELTTNTMVNCAAFLGTAIIFYFSPLFYALKSRFSVKESILINKQVIVNYLSCATAAVFFLSYRFPVFGNIQTLELPFFTMGSYGFDNIETFLWVFVFKVSFLSITTFWFFSEKRWWKYALLSPILVTFHQIRMTITPDNYFFDELEFLNALPLFFLLVLVLLLLSKNAKDQYYFRTLYDEAVLSMEKRTIRKYNKQNDTIREIKKKMEHLKTNHSELGEHELLHLKEELEKQLKHS